MFRALRTVRNLQILVLVLSGSGLTVAGVVAASRGYLDGLRPTLERYLQAARAEVIAWVDQLTSQEQLLVIATLIAAPILGLLFLSLFNER